MQRKTKNSLSKYLEPVILSHIDLQYIEQTLYKLSSELTYIVGEYQAENLNDLSENYHEKKLSQLTIKSRNPWLFILFTANKVLIQCDSEKLDARGVYAEIVDFLEAKKRDENSVRKQIYNIQQTVFYALLLNVILRGAGDVYFRLFFLYIILLVCEAIIPYPSIIYTSKNKLNFLDKNLDNVLVSLIGAAANAIIAVGLTYIFLSK